MKAYYDIGFDGYARPDHGRMIWDEVAMPGYGLYDRALGAAYLAGLAVGFWKDKDDIRSNWALERTFAPVMEPKDRDRRLKGWKKAVRAALYFANDEEE